MLNCGDRMWYKLHISVIIFFKWLFPREIIQNDKIIAFHRKVSFPQLCFMIVSTSESLRGLAWELVPSLVCVQALKQAIFFELLYFEGLCFGPLHFRRSRTTIFAYIQIVSNSLRGVWRCLLWLSRFSSVFSSSLTKMARKYCFCT